jgi:predicted HicB family RNase H-like nuclease
MSKEPLTTRISTETHFRLRLHAAVTRDSIAKIVEEALQAHLPELDAAELETLRQFTEAGA